MQKLVFFFKSAFIFAFWGLAITGCKTTNSKGSNGTGGVAFPDARASEYASLISISYGGYINDLESRLIKNDIRVMEYYRFLKEKKYCTDNEALIIKYIEANPGYLNYLRAAEANRSLKQDKRISDDAPRQP